MMADYFHWFDLLGIAVFAISGTLADWRNQMDGFGVIVLASVTAIGGGTLRDILLDRRPFFWIENSYWLWALLALVVIAMLLMRSRHLQLTERAIQLPDALGLGLFTALGTQIALGDGLSGIAAVLMGVISAVFGGVLRDVFCNEIPKAFSDHQPYALCALLGGSALVLLQHLGLPDSLALIAAFGLTSALRILTILRGWRMPGWRV